MRVRQLLFSEQSSEYFYYMSLRTFVHLALVGMAVGVLTWLVAVGINRFMLVPMFCGNVANAALCAQGTVIAAAMSGVLVGIMAVPVLAMLRVRRPLLVVVAVFIALWQLDVWSMAPLWAMLWSAIAYGLMYLALLWLNRIRGNGAALLLMAVLVALARVVIAL